MHIDIFLLLEIKLLYNKSELSRNKFYYSLQRVL